MGNCEVSFSDLYAGPRRSSKVEYDYQDKKGRNDQEKGIIISSNLVEKPILRR
jgi:hypothetical protein